MLPKAVFMRKTDFEKAEFACLPSFPSSFQANPCQNIFVMISTFIAFLEQSSIVEFLSVKSFLERTQGEK
jgi:hypothetical protein